MRRKNKYSKKLLKLLVYWLPIVTYITMISPVSVISFAGFYVLLVISLFFTLKSFFALGRTIVWLGIIVTYLLLRQFRMDNILNILILTGIFVTMEIYFRKS